ncbi:MAG: four helix bundle protein [Candidatus Omnitrophica bacterium]|nr:four helix bundle protein [Candidatus Omnitrophota bacterium]
MIKSIRDLQVYNLAFESAMEIFNLTKKFPKEELYSLVDQIKRTSRSIAVNIREGFAKKEYKDVFIRHLIDGLGSSEETRSWLDFSYESGYLIEENYTELFQKYDKISAMLYKLIKSWRKF